MVQLNDIKSIDTDQLELKEPPTEDLAYTP